MSPETRSTRLSLTGIRKHFRTGPHRVEVLRGVDLELSAGENLAVTGPSGSGKSTLLHLVGALDAPSAGSLTIDGRDPNELPEGQLARFRNRVVGFVFQDHHLLPQYELLENVLIPTRAFPPPPPDAEEWARSLLERVGLGHRLTHRPGELSGGERQRAAVARALINRPAVLLGDEPTGNLDRDNATGVVDLLLELHREAANILVVVTHSREVAARFGRRVELRDGRCVEV